MGGYTMPSLYQKLSSLGNVKVLDKYTFEINNMKIILNSTKPGVKYLILGKEMIGFKKQNDLMRYLKPDYGDVYTKTDDFPKDFIATEMKEFQQAGNAKEYKTHCYNENQAIELTKRFRDSGRYESVDWNYNLIEKCYVVECKKVK